MELGLTFSGVGAILGAGGILGRHWLLLWPGLAFLVVGTAYLGSAPWMLGKRADGSLPLVWWIVLLPYFGFAWIAWTILRLGKEPTCDEVAPGIYVGRRPRGKDLPAGVQLVVDLTAEFPRASDLRAPGYRCLPTLDGTPPDPRKLRALAGELAAAPGPLYIHCAAGHARSATLAAAVMIERGLAGSVDEAERIMRTVRPGIHINRHQRRMLAAAGFDGRSDPEHVQK